MNNGSNLKSKCKKQKKNILHWIIWYAPFASEMVGAKSQGRYGSYAHQFASKMVGAKSQGRCAFSQQILDFCDENDYSTGKVFLMLVTPPN